MKEAVGDNFSPKCMMMFGTLGEGKEGGKKAEERKEKTESEKSKMVKAGLEILCSTHSTVIDFGSHCRLFESASKHTISLVRSGAKGRKEKEKEKKDQANLTDTKVMIATLRACAHCTFQFHSQTCPWNFHFHFHFHATQVFTVTVSPPFTPQPRSLAIWSTKTT